MTVYSPMMRHKMNQPGKSLGVIGLGRLGHVGLKFGKAFGLRVTVFSTSVSKKDEAINVLGADNFVIMSEEKSMKAMGRSLDFIIDMPSENHKFDPYMSLLKTRGVFVLVGFPNEVKFSPKNLDIGSKVFSGSMKGAIEVSQQMIDFCADHKVYPEIELVPIEYCTEAIVRLVKRDVRYLFVIDVQNSLK